MGNLLYVEIREKMIALYHLSGSGTGTVPSVSISSLVVGVMRKAYSLISLRGIRSYPSSDSMRLSSAVYTSNASLVIIV